MGGAFRDVCGEADVKFKGRPVWGFTVPRGPCGAGRGVEGSKHPDGAAGQTAGVCGPEVVAAAALVTLVRAGG